MKFIREQLGEFVGKAIAPVVQKISAARKARTFHPDGLVFRARVEALSDLGERLSGSALVRCSGALWKRGPQLPDVLGVAVRFRAGHSVSPEVELADQDLLFATIVSPVTMPLSALTTDVGDFSHNHFWAVSPFDVRQSGRVKFRLTPGFQTSHPGTREQRLREAVEPRGRDIYAGGATNLDARVATGRAHCPRERAEHRPSGTAFFSVQRRQGVCAPRLRARAAQSGLPGEPRRATGLSRRAYRRGFKVMTPQETRSPEF